MTSSAAQAPPQSPPPGPDAAPWAAPWALFATIALTFAALFAVTLALPHDPYIRYQQLAKTIQFRSQWIYERIALDRTPIDIAIVGNSRLGAGISGPQLQAALDRASDRPLRVANLSMPQEGRNIHYVIVKRLLQDHPEVKLIVLSAIEQMPRSGHPAFRDLADPGDVIGAPRLLNLDYLGDAAVLPYRQISLFVQSLAPALFGDATRLDPLAYPGTDFDSTETIHLPNGRIVDRDSVVDEAALAAAAAHRAASAHAQVLPPALAPYEFVQERYYTQRIAELARRHGVTLLFVQIPIFQDQTLVGDPDFYAPYGRIVRAPGIDNDYRLYSDYGHMNVNGTRQVTAWLAGVIGGIPAIRDASTKP